MALLHEYLLAERAYMMVQNIRFSTIGRRSELPAQVLAEIDENIRLSQGNTGMNLCLAINYGGRAEIVDAVQRLGRQIRSGQIDPESIDEGTLTDALVHSGHA